MATSYPAGFDVFDVPGDPSSTTLSSPGTGSKNHTTHHRDLGDAVMALQANATKSSHTHDGNGLNGPKLLQANTHQSADTDASQIALHHTLGTGAFQAAQGNHQHGNYVDLSGAQTITGKKTFPTGANAPVMTDFTNAQHNHADADDGGIAFATKISSLGAEGGHTAAVATTDIQSDFYLTNLFTVPAGAGFIASLYINYASHNATPGLLLENLLFYVSFNIGGKDPIYQANHNIVAGISDHWRSTTRVDSGLDTFHSGTIPLYMPPVAADVNIRISCRAYNPGSSNMIAANYVVLGTLVRN